jgi:hypothetical protein
MRLPWRGSSDAHQVLDSPAGGGGGLRSFSKAWLVCLVAFGWILSAVVGGTRIAAASTTLRVPEDHPSIQSAINAASDGDIIDVAPGTYRERITVGKSVTIVGRDHDPIDPRNNTTILDGTGGTVVTVPRGVVPGPTLIGLAIRNGDDGISPRSSFTIQYSYLTANIDDIDYETGGGGLCANNVFELSGDDAIDLDHPIVDLVIERNRILYANDDGIEIRLHDDAIAETADIVIRHNEIVGSRRDGVQIIDYYQDTNRTITIERNLIRNVGKAAIGLMDDAQTTEDFRAASIRERIHVFHNTLVGNDHGVSGGDNLIALNNIFQGHVVALKNVDGDSIASHNLFWDNTTDATGSVVDATTTLVADPFLDADHHLAIGSPAIDAGTAYFEWLGEIVMDQPASAYEGAAPDLGWHERDAGGTSNTPPVVDSVEIDRASPKTNDLLTVTATAHDEDGDRLTYSYQWLKNGTELAGAIGPILDLSVVGNGDKGDAIAVRVTASDGVDESVPATSPSVTIANSDPVFDRDLQDRTSAEGDAVSVSAGATDPDGDALTYEASGLPPGVSIDAQTGAIAGTIAEGASAGSPYAVSVTVGDGSEVDDLDTFMWTVRERNGVPVVVSVQIEQTDPRTDDTLTVAVSASDPDGDPLTYSYQWIGNGVDLAGATDPTLDLSVAGNGDAGDEIAVRVAASDGIDESVPATSPPVTVANSDPVVSVGLAPTAPRTNDLLVATVSGSDLDGDPLTYTYRWLVNDVLVRTVSGSMVTDALDLSAAGNGDRGDQVRVEVVASDGTGTSETASDQVTVANSDPVFDQDLQDRTSAEGDGVSLSAGATDPDGDALTYEASGLPPGVEIDDVTGAITGTIAEGASAGSPYAVSVTVRDGSAADDLDTFTWTVTSPDLPPATPAALASSVTSVSIVLDWADTFEADVIGYRVYRAGSAEGPFVLLTSTPLVASAYEDPSAPPGATSHYRVTAVDGVGQESSPATTSATRTIWFRSASSAVARNKNVLTVPAPTGRTSGDVLVGAVLVHGTASVSPPAGWTLVRRDVNGSAVRQLVYAKVAGGNEPSSYTWSLSAKSNAIAIVAAHVGLDPSATVDVSGGQANASSTAITAPAVSTTVGGALLVGVFGISTDTTTTIAEPSGMISHAEVALPGGRPRLTLELADEILPVAGTSGPRTAVSARAGPSIGQLVALRPAGP